MNLLIRCLKALSERVTRKNSSYMELNHVHYPKNNASVSCMYTINSFWPYSFHHCAMHSPAHCGCKNSCMHLVPLQRTSSLSNTSASIFNKITRKKWQHEELAVFPYTFFRRVYIYESVRYIWHLKFKTFCYTVLLHYHTFGSQIFRLTSSNTVQPSKTLPLKIK